MSFILWAWISTISFGVEAVLGKLTVKHSVTNPWLFNFIWSLFILLITLVLGLFNHVGFPHDWWFIIFCAINYAVTNLLYIIALKYIDITVLSPMFNLRMVFTVMLGVFLLNENITIYQWMLIGIITILGFIVQYDEKLKIKSFIKLGSLIALFEMITLSFYYFFIKKAMVNNGYWEVSVWVMVIGQIIILTTFPFFKRDLGKVKAKQLLPLLFVAIAGTLGMLCLNKANATNISITGAITAFPSSMILTLLISLIWPNLLEKHPPRIWALRIISAVTMGYAALRLGG